jgi:Tfp pilus assembly protein FimV
MAFGLAAAPGSQAANLVNWDGLKSSFTYTPMAGESLDRIIAKTMPNSDLKAEVVAEAFKALNPLQLSKEANSVAKSSIALKVPNQNQMHNMVEAQLGDKQTMTALAQAETKAGGTKPQVKGMLAGTTTATHKINSKTEAWVRFPARLMSLSKKVEGWVRFPNLGVTTTVASDWVRYPSVANHDLGVMSANKPSPHKQIDQREWVRYQIAKADESSE